MAQQAAEKDSLKAAFNAARPDATISRCRHRCHPLQTWCSKEKEMSKFSSLLDEPSAEYRFWRKEALKAETRAGLAQAEYELARSLEDACRVLAEQQQ